MATNAVGKVKFTGAVAAMTAAAIATAGLGSAPTANAACASFFGIVNSPNCTSTPLSIAIAIGNGSSANAKGLFGAAFAAGGSTVETDDAFTFGIGVGNNAFVVAKGLFGIAVAVGPETTAGTDGDPNLGNLGFNIALNLSPTNKAFRPTVAGGVGNVAVNLFGINEVTQQEVLATGYFSTAGNFGGKDNEVWAASGILSNSYNFLGSGNSVKSGDGVLDNAFNLVGSSNTVYASPGPLAIAGSIFQSNKSVVKQKPGININGLKVPNTAAANSKPKSSAAKPAKAADAKSGSDAKSGRKASQ